jgi:predicted acetyltransferase
VEDGEFIGRISIRHQLTDMLTVYGGHIGYEIRPSMRRRGYGTLMLKLVLPEAYRLGLTRVLITCDDTNIPSAKIIESNGGVLIDVQQLDFRPVPTRRYWIAIEA